jgi:hypothetical protein
MVLPLRRCGSCTDASLYTRWQQKESPAATFDTAANKARPNEIHPHAGLIDQRSW